MSESRPLPVRNVLFIMCDQLRWDYLSCSGHPNLHTPHLDALAKRGVRFDRAYVQGSICTSSRMSTYTGRYVSSHGVSENEIPLSIGQKTLGDHLRPHAVRCAVVGKTHVTPDLAGAARLGIDVTRGPGLLAMQGGFEPYARDDGFWLPGFEPAVNHYREWLNAHGYPGRNPWMDFANSGRGANGEILSGLKMRWASQPAAIAEEHSETAYTTNRAIDFIHDTGDKPWVLHLSYVKPHWPYVAPAPYHAMFTPEQIIPVVRHPDELRCQHPIVDGYRRFLPSVNFSRDEVRNTVIPTYMGLIRQIDDHLGRLFAFLRDSGREQDTLIIFTSDHGDYLGDHWLGEKGLFHEMSVRVPLILFDPRSAADSTRGSKSGELVEAIDLLPTILDAFGIHQPSQWLEGQSLVPLLHAGAGYRPRDVVVSEGSYAFRDVVRQPISQPVDQCAMIMIRSDRWKYFEYQGARPQLFDLASDPDEFVDLGGDPGYSNICTQMRDRLHEWRAQRRVSTTISPEEIEAYNLAELDIGFSIGDW